MQLVRNTTDDGSCKYALIRIDKIRKKLTDSKADALSSICNYVRLLLSITDTNNGPLKDCVEFGEPKTENEFFVIKLKDIHSKAALLAYADNVGDSDPEYATQIRELAARAGIDHPSCRKPD